MLIVHVWNLYCVRVMCVFYRLVYLSLAWFENDKSSRCLNNAANKWNMETLNYFLEMYKKVSNSTFSDPFSGSVTEVFFH